VLGFWPDVITGGRLELEPSDTFPALFEKTVFAFNQTGSGSVAKDDTFGVTIEVLTDSQLS